MKAAKRRSSREATGYRPKASDLAESCAWEAAATAWVIPWFWPCFSAWVWGGTETSISMRPGEVSRVAALRPMAMVKEKPSGDSAGAGSSRVLEGEDERMSTD